MVKALQINFIDLRTPYLLDNVASGTNVVPSIYISI